MHTLRLLGALILVLLACSLVGSAAQPWPTFAEAFAGHAGELTAAGPLGAQAGDYGDAPDPPYPSAAARNGARHLDPTHEWLGSGVDVETDTRQVNSDAFDDGVSLFAPYLPGELGRLDFDVHVADPGGSRYGSEPERQIYVNAWLDWNGDGDWDDPEEHAVAGLAVCPADWADGETSAWVTGTFTVPTSVTEGPLWVRVRLDYGENIPTPTGVAAFGEVEDYRSDTLEVPGEYPDIQSAVDAAAAHDGILVAPGTYRSPIKVTTDHLSLRGAGQDVTYVVAVLPVGPLAQEPQKAVIEVGPVSEFKISGLTITVSEPIAEVQVAPEPHPSGRLLSGGRRVDLRPTGAAPRDDATATPTATATATATASPTPTPTPTTTPMCWYGLYLDDVGRVVARGLSFWRLPYAGMGGKAKNIYFENGKITFTPYGVTFSMDGGKYTAKDISVAETSTAFDFSGKGQVIVSKGESEKNDILLQANLQGKVGFSAWRSFGDGTVVAGSIEGEAYFYQNLIHDCYRGLYLRVSGNLLLQHNKIVARDTAVEVEVRSDAKFSSTNDNLTGANKAFSATLEGNAKASLNRTVMNNGDVKVSAEANAEVGMTGCSVYSRFGAGVTIELGAGVKATFGWNSFKGGGDSDRKFMFNVVLPFGKVAGGLIAGQQPGTVTIRGNTFAWAYGGAIHVEQVPEGTAVEISDNWIVGSGKDGVLVSQGPVAVRGNRICYNRRDGVRVEGIGLASLGRGEEGSGGGNVLAHNGQFDVRLLSVLSLPARRNDWGETTTREMDLKGPFGNITAIYDGRDTEFSGLVDYAGWLPPSRQCDWLEYGDALDPPYRTLLRHDGPRHLDPFKEWLGVGVDLDPDARVPGFDQPGDLTDDGVRIPELLVAGSLTEIVAHISTSGEGPTRYGPGRELHLVGWVDWNGDGDWDDSGERVLAWSGGPGLTDTLGTPWPAGEVAHMVRVALVPPVIIHAMDTAAEPITTAARFRLTYGEPAETPFGLAVYGEVEDYMARYSSVPITPDVTPTGTGTATATPSAPPGTTVPAPGTSTATASPSVTPSDGATATASGTPGPAVTLTGTAPPTSTATPGGRARLFLPFVRKG